MADKNITISQILKGVTAGKMQSVGYMQIIPLVTELVDNSFSAPDNLLTSTLEYGTMVAENPGKQTSQKPS